MVLGYDHLRWNPSFLNEDVGNQRSLNIWDLDNQRPQKVDFEGRMDHDGRGAILFFFDNRDELVKEYYKMIDIQANVEAFEEEVWTNKD